MSTREHILGIACRCFAQKGRDGVSMRQISAETGLTMPTLYHHFGDKRSLYAACVTSVFDASAGALRDAFNSSRIPAERTRAFASALCEQLLRSPSLLPFLQMEFVYGAAPMERLVPNRLRERLASAIGASGVGNESSMGSEWRLVAYAFGYAALAGITPVEPAVPSDFAALAEELLAASRIRHRLRPPVLD
ncbi:TetR/AcrR family transcriptional regulator [Scleromatobacter humisilvae]|uniref:TetR/AcrR family transcriptional regulator n=1 Tax=Scleromatobacter humisilvae TaxID=2897159 RepID=A0A9X2C212_9BURK|nr:TetR/AcrR family transcriptional regulator [Scleromatobacter humisilvae]MCK9686314.1 TetR/AcrR family transcriptional regulator [Scleromatobacter humisilvae]